jgi:predicted ester cyclase
VSQANKQLVLQAIHGLDCGDPDAYAELHHPDYVNHEAAASRQRGREGARATAVFLNDVFADMHHEPLDVIAERDLVVVRAQASGRQVGEITGFPATGRSFSVQHIHMFRVVDAQIIEHWACRDDLGAARQLGFMPARIGNGGLRARCRRWLRRRGGDGHRSTFTPDKPAPIDYAQLAAAAGPWLAWAGIPLHLTPLRRERDGR